MSERAGDTADGRKAATPAAADPAPADRGPTSRSRARQGRELGRQDAAAQEVASGRVTDPERAAGAPAPSTATDTPPQRTRAPRRGRRQERTRRPPAAARENPDGDKDPSASEGDEAPAEEVVPALPGKQGCSERSERNPPCVTTPYALLAWSHSHRPRALAAGGCVRGELGKQSISAGVA